MEVDVVMLRSHLGYLVNHLQNHVLPELEMKKILLPSTTISLMQPATVTRIGLQGRPSLIVDIDQMISLRCIRFKWKDIADLMGVSVRTLHHHRQDFGIGNNLRFSHISNEELYSQLRQMKEEFPDIGERIALGFFVAKE